jgi:uncharacterized repeat protein (TIGR01451 family)
MKEGEEDKIMRKIFATLAVLLLLAVIAAPPAMAAGTPSGTAISNQAYADYKDANGNAMTRVYSNTVTVTVSQVAGVSTTPATAANNAVAGTNIAYPVIITNTGNGADTITLAASTSSGTVTIYKDDNGDGVWQSATETTVVTDTGALAADAGFKAFAVVAVPAAAANGSTITTTLTGTTTWSAPAVATATSTFTTTVQTAVMTVSKYVVDPASNTTLVTSAKPGDIITYMVTAANSGASSSYDLIYSDLIPANTTYVAGSMKAGASASYNAAPKTLTDANDGNEFSPDGGTTQVGAYFDSANKKVVLSKTQNPPQGNFYFQVRVNANVPAGTVISNTLSIEYALVASSPTRYTSTSNAATVSVAQLSGASVTATTTALSGDPSSQIVYPFTVTNTGNATDTIDLTYTSSSGWTYVFWVDVDGNGIPGTDGDYMLTDTDGDGKVDTGALPQNGHLALLAVTTIPVGTANGTVDTLTITGTTSLAPTATATATATTTVKAPVLAVSKTIEAIQAPGGGTVCTPTNKTTGAGCTIVPGSVLTYQVKATNNGTGNATAVVITDMVPIYTTYVAGSIRTGTSAASLAPRTDAADGDGGRFDSGSHAVIVGGSGNLTLGPTGTWVLEFKVAVN